MHIKILGSTFCIVIFSNFLLYEARSLYVTNPYEYMLSKRDIELERRDFLKSFCARRCNIGKGGNICRCNGYHFAGKRTSDSPTHQEAPEKLNEEESNEIVYKILRENNAIAMNPGVNRNTGMTVPRKELIRMIMEILPRIMNGEYDSREQEPSYEDLVGDYSRFDEI